MGLVYKYLQADDYLFVLVRQTLLFRSAAALNDVFESQPEYGLNLEGDAEEIKQQIRAELPVSGDPRYHGKSEEEINRILALSGVDVMFSLARMKRLLFHTGAEMFSPVGVLSLSESSQNLLLWSHYAEGGKGFVVGFDPEARIFRDSSYLGVSGLHPVTYEERRPVLNEPDFPTRMFSVIFQKSKEWEYEKERRCLREVPDGADHLILGFDKADVREIIIGPRMDPAKAEMIYELRDLHFPHAGIKAATPNAREYCMDLDDLPPRNLFGRFWRIAAKQSSRIREIAKTAEVMGPMKARVPPGSSATVSLRKFAFSRLREKGPQTWTRSPQHNGVADAATRLRRHPAE